MSALAPDAVGTRTGAVIALPLIGLPLASVADTLEEHRFIQLFVLGGSLLALSLLRRVMRRPIAS